MKAEKRCEFNTARRCDGLCNNCGKNIKPDQFSKYKIVPASPLPFPDYEGRCLRDSE